MSSCTKKNTENKPAKNGQAQKDSGVCHKYCEPVEPSICIDLIREQPKCAESKNAPSCKKFVSSFKLALRKIHCSNSCEKEPYTQAISYKCDVLDTRPTPKVTERSARLLSQLPFEEARALFISKEFEAILDGALAEAILPKVKQARAKKK